MNRGHRECVDHRLIRLSLNALKILRRGELRSGTREDVPTSARAHRASRGLPQNASAGPLTAKAVVSEVCNNRQESVSSCDPQHQHAAASSKLMKLRDRPLSDIRSAKKLPRQRPV